jgi:hypothetical protein
VRSTTHRVAPTSRCSLCPSLLCGSLSRAFSRLLCTSCHRRLCVGVQLLGRPPGSAPRTLNGLYGVDELFEGHRVVDVCGGEHHRQRDTPSVRNKVALGALLSLIRGIRSGFWAPFWQGWKPNRVRHAPSRSARPLRGGPEELGAAFPTPQPHAIPSSVASKSSPSRSPSPLGASPRGYRSLARRRFPLELPDRRCAVFHLGVLAAREAEAVRWFPTVCL